MRAARAVPLVLLLAGCSLGTRHPDACVASADCRLAFGAGYYCETETGLCRRVESEVCPELFPPAARTDPRAILLGTIFDRSSPNQLARERAARLAVSGLNEGAGIDARTVALLHCDSSVAGAVRASEALAAAGVPAIIGPSSSSDTEAVFTALSSDSGRGTLVISPSATATQLTAIDPVRPGLLWRTAPPDSLQAAVIEADLEDEATGSLSIVSRMNDTYAQSLSVLLHGLATDAGITVVETPQFRDREGVESATAAALGPSPPDVVIFISSQVADAAAFLDAAAALPGYDGVSIHLPDAAANDDLFTLTGAGSSRFAQVRATRPAAPHTIITSEFVSAYRAANDGEDPLSFSFTAHAYDATALVLLGVGYASRGGGRITGRRIAEGIARTSGGAVEAQLLAANFNAIIQELRTHEVGVDVVGASGPLDYDPSDEELTSASYEILQIAGGRFEVLATVDAPP